MAIFCVAGFNAVPVRLLAQARVSHIQPGLRAEWKIQRNAATLRGRLQMQSLPLASVIEAHVPGIFTLFRSEC